MKTALLDVNVLTALLWPAHEHHDAAHRWFSARADAAWATCSLTQLGFVRLVSNPAFSRDALSPAGAVALLAANLSHATHEFWRSAPIAGRSRNGASWQGTGLTDAYRWPWRTAARASGTFDRGLRSPRATRSTRPLKSFHAIGQGLKSASYVAKSRPTDHPGILRSRDSTRASGSPLSPPAHVWQRSAASPRASHRIQSQEEP